MLVRDVNLRTRIFVSVPSRYPGKLGRALVKELTLRSQLVRFVSRNIDLPWGSVAEAIHAIRELKRKCFCYGRSVGRMRPLG